MANRPLALAALAQDAIKVNVVSEFIGLIGLCPPRRQHLQQHFTLHGNSITRLV